MNYKWIVDKCDGMDVRLFGMTIVALENFEDPSPFFTEFIKEHTPEELAEYLGFKTDKETIDLLERNLKDDEFELLMLSNNRDGFLCSVGIAEFENFSFNEDGRATSWTSSSGCCAMYYVYASNLGELMYKIEKKYEQHKLDCIKREQADESDE